MRLIDAITHNSIPQELDLYAALVDSTAEPETSEKGFYYGSRTSFLSKDIAVRKLLDVIAVETGCTTEVLESQNRILNLLWKRLPPPEVRYSY